MKKFLIAFSLVAFCLLTTYFLLPTTSIIAWTEPTLAPPSGNVLAPLRNPITSLTISATGVDGINIGPDTGATGNSGRLLFTNNTNGFALMNNGGIFTLRYGAVPLSTSGTIGLQMNGSGAVAIPGALTVAGQSVCLANGTGCPASSGIGGSGTIARIPRFTAATTLGDSSLTSDGVSSTANGNLFTTGNFFWGATSNNLLNSAGSEELGGTNTVANPLAGGTPYIDFHYGTGAIQDYNARLINSANNRLDISTASGGVVLTVNGGNVGVKTATTNQELSVAGDVEATGQVRGRGWIAGTGTGQGAEIGVTGGFSYFMGYDRTALTYAPARLVGSTIDLRHSNASSDLFIDTSGNVGLGTAAPGAKLEVAGQVKITGGVPGAGKILTSDATGLASWTTPAASGVDGSGTVNFLSRFTPNGTTLGDSTISSDGLSSTANGNLFVSDGFFDVVRTASPGSGLTLSLDGNNFGRLANLTSGIAILTNNAEAMRILSNGYVGIGTSGPSDRLHVGGSTRIGLVTNDDGGTASEGDRLYLSGGDDFTSFDSDNSDPIWLARYNSGNDQSQLRINVGDGASASDKIELGTTVSGAWTPRLSVGMDGSVGVGVSAPSTRFHVVGPTGTSILRVNDSATGGILSLGSDGTGQTHITMGGSGTIDGQASQLQLRGSGTNAVAIYTNGAQRAVVNSSGDVGIGTAAPGAKLEVAGQVKITGGVPGTGKVLTSDAAGLASWTTPAAAIGGSGTIGAVPRFTAASTLGDSSLTSNGVSATANGNLFVTSQLFWGASSQNALLADQGGSIELGGTNSVANPIASGAPYLDFHYGTGAAQDYNMRIINSASGRLDITNPSVGPILSTNGANVTIGNASPTQKLTVLDNINDSEIIRGTTGTHHVGLGVDSVGTNWGASLFQDGVKRFTVESNGGVLIGGGYQASNAPANGAIIEGNVGIGTVAPGYKLDVNGITNTEGLHVDALPTRAGLVDINTGSASTANSIFYASVWDNITPSAILGVNTNNPVTVPVYGISGKSAGYTAQAEQPSGGAPPGIPNVAGVNGEITSGWGGVGVRGYAINPVNYGYGVLGIGGRVGVYGKTTYAATGVNGYGVYCEATVSNIYALCGGNKTWTNTASDIRLKKNVEEISDALSKLLKIRGVTFSYKSDPNDGRYAGFIANEVHEVLPEATGINPETGYYTINESQVGALVVEAVKELNAKVDKLKTENDYLRARLEKLEAKVR